MALNKSSQGFKKNIPKPSKETLRMYFEQNWDHLNHLRSIIMWYTEVYMGVIAGSLALMGLSDIEAQSFLIYLFFLIIAIIGILITVRMNIRLKVRMKVGVQIMDKLELEEYNEIIRKGGGYYTWMDCILFFFCFMVIIWIIMLYKTPLPF
jgi:hypothetical protein